MRIGAIGPWERLSEFNFYLGNLCGTGPLQDEIVGWGQSLGSCLRYARLVFLPFTAGVIDYEIDYEICLRLNALALWGCS